MELPAAALLVRKFFELPTLHWPWCAPKTAERARHAPATNASLLGSRGWGRGWWAAARRWWRALARRGGRGSIAPARPQEGEVREQRARTTGDEADERAPVGRAPAARVARGHGASREEPKERQEQRVKGPRRPRSCSRRGCSRCASRSAYGSGMPIFGPRLLGAMMAVGRAGWRVAQSRARAVHRAIKHWSNRWWAGVMGHRKSSKTHANSCGRLSSLAAATARSSSAHVRRPRHRCARALGPARRPLTPFTRAAAHLLEPPAVVDPPLAVEPAVPSARAVPRARSPPPAPPRRALTLPVLGLCCVVASLCALDRVVMSMAILPMGAEFGHGDATRG